MPHLSSSARLPLLALLFVAGCGQQREPQADNQAAPPEPANALAPAATPSPAATPTPAPTGSGAAIKADDPGLAFSYAWPAVAAAIPELDSWLRGNGEHLRREAAGRARSEIAEARKGGFDMHDHSYEETWKVAADGPALLILQSEGYIFTGGAHGMPIVTTLFWDKAAKRRLGLTDLFDTARLVPAIRAGFCKALDDERAKRRGAPVDAKDSGGIDEFVRCVDPAKQIILPVARRGGALDTVRVVIMPYEAGPYAEGIYQLDLPVTEAVMAAVKPGYRAAFSAAR